MAYSPHLPVEESVTEDKRYARRIDSYATPLSNHTFRTFVPLQATPDSLRMSVSPIKSSYGESARPSPRTRDQKQVTFELLLPVPQSRARLPMRVMISRHDTTDSIITTVKNFYGLYEGPGVSFQDREGNILIAAYENFEHGMTVYVKVSDDVPMITDPPVQASPKKPKLGPPFEMRPPSQNAIKTRSPSPSAMSATARGRARSTKSQDLDGHDMFSDSDGGNGSVSSSRRSRAEAHASAEISVDNILEGGRRKRAKFESSVCFVAVASRFVC